VETTAAGNSTSKIWILIAGVALSFAMSVWILFNVWTAPAGLFWHLFHGKFASFDGRRIHVPWDMWVSSSGVHSLSIIRDAPLHPFLHSPSGILLFVRRQGPATDMSKNYDRIATAYRSRAGYLFQGVQELEGRNGIVFCWELTTADSSSSSISCLFDEDTLSANFEGSAVYPRIS
jgi:hypothetical protein